VVPILPALTIDVPGTGMLPRGCAALSDEEIIQRIEEWREAWPEIAATPGLKEQWDRIYRNAKRRCEEQQKREGSGSADRS
jgi:hypothetical protein